MNHNILGKIIDNVALNQWHHKIKKINIEYGINFYVSETKNIFHSLQCIGKYEGMPMMTVAFNYRSRLNIYGICRYDYRKRQWLRVSQLHKNYW